MASYEPSIYPVNGPDMWVRTGLRGKLPPNVKRQPERPKKQRESEADEPVKNATKLRRKNTTTTCSQCGNLGHNKSYKGQSMAKESRKEKGVSLFISIPVNVLLSSNTDN